MIHLLACFFFAKSYLIKISNKKAGETGLILSQN